MDSNLNLSNASAAAMAVSLASLLDGGSLRLYSGTQPVTADTALSGNTLLAELTFQTPAETSTTNGVITFDTLTADVSANATGTAAWFRAVTSGSATVFDGTIGTSGADLNMNSVAITAGSNVSVTSVTLIVTK